LKIKFFVCVKSENNGAIDIGYFRVTFVSEESFFGEVSLKTKKKLCVKRRDADATMHRCICAATC